VIGLIAGVALAWPAQLIFGGNVDKGTYVGQCGGLVVAAFVARFLIRELRKREASSGVVTVPAPDPRLRVGRAMSKGAGTMTVMVPPDNGPGT
jgi:hypothetical protein